SFGFDFERRDITENSFILATTLDSNFNAKQVNEALVTPQVRTNISPRIDYQINGANTLVGRYQHTAISLENEGIGNYNLRSRAYNTSESEDTVQLTETAVLSPRMINELRFQFSRSNTAHSGGESSPSLSVQGAFEGGGAQVGNSGSLTNRWEINNSTSFTRRSHTIKWGGRIRQAFIDDRSVNNFGGTYTFLGGLGPELDANNRAIAGSSVQLQAIERYRRTLLFQSLGYTASQIRALGGGASYFNLSAGTPATSIQQVELGFFFNDD